MEGSGELLNFFGKLSLSRLPPIKSLVTNSSIFGALADKLPGQSDKHADLTARLYFDQVRKVGIVLRVVGTITVSLKDAIHARVIRQTHGC